MVSPLQKVTVGGKQYPVSWGNYAIDLYTSIPFEDRQLQGVASWAQFLWAQIAIIDNPPFRTWRAALFALSNETPESRDSIVRIVNSLIPAPEPISDEANSADPKAEPAEAEKKSASLKTEPSPASS